MNKELPKELNDKRIKSFQTTDKRIILTDHSVGGLTVRIYPSGKKSFYLRYRWNDSVIDYKIGDFSEIGIGKARKKARKLKSQVRDGFNPMAEKKARMQIPDILTIKDLAEDFKRDYLPKKKESTRNSYSCRIDKIVGKFGKKSIDELTGREIKRWLKSVSKDHPTNANRLQSILSKMYSFANEPDQGYTTNHPLRGMDKVGAETQRNPNYSPDDIRTLWQAIEDQAEPVQSLLKILLLTGQRLGETSRMKWSQIDRNNALWIIPKSETKGKTTHVVPLSDMAIDILENVHMLTGKDEHVFSSPKKKNQPLAHFGSIPDRIRKYEGLEGFKIHDLRHIVITEMISIGIDMVHVGKTVAHKGLGKEYAITNRYAHYEYMDEKREALKRYSYHLQGILNGETETKFFKIGKVS